MGPISLSFADASQVKDATDTELAQQMLEEKKQMKSISSITTEEWRAKYEKDGMVDLWVEEEFNSGSRLKVSSPSLHLTLCTLSPLKLTAF
jgi:ferredoxin